MDAEVNEEFDSLNSVGAASTLFGKVYNTLAIPLDKTRRFVWIALDAYVRAALADEWFAEGEVRFTRYGTPVLTIPVSRGNSNRNFNNAAQFALAKQWAATWTGGIQPALRFEDVYCIPACAQTSVQIACMEIEVEADQAQLFVKSVTGDAALVSMSFVIGLRIQSQ